MKQACFGRFDIVPIPSTFIRCTCIHKVPKQAAPQVGMAARTDTSSGCVATPLLLYIYVNVISFHFDFYINFPKRKAWKLLHLIQFILWPYPSFNSCSLNIHLLSILPAIYLISTSQTHSSLSANLTARRVEFARILTICSG